MRVSFEAPASTPDECRRYTIRVDAEDVTDQVAWAFDGEVLVGTLPITPPPALPAATHGGKAHRNAGRNERAIALWYQPKADSDGQRVLQAFIRCHQAGEDGLTNYQLAHRTGMALYTAAPRVTELKHAGWVEDTGKTRPSDNGNPAEIRRLTAEGARRLNLQVDQTTLDDFLPPAD